MRTKRKLWYIIGLIVIPVQFTLGQPTHSGIARSTNNVSIAQIQGSSVESPMVNKLVTTRGIVTAIFNAVEPYQGAGFTSDLAGFFLQDLNGDGNADTSEDISVLKSQLLLEIQWL
jgi:predicted extracellular nuclease